MTPSAWHADGDPSARSTIDGLAMFGGGALFEDWPSFPADRCVPFDPTTKLDPIRRNRPTERGALAGLGMRPGCRMS